MKKAKIRLLPLVAALALSGVSAQQPVAAETAASAQPAARSAAPARSAGAVATRQNGNDAVKSSVEARASQAAEKSRATVIKDAVAALTEINKALAALDENKKQEALDALAAATGKLELVVSRDPALALAPVAVHVLTTDLVASVDTIKDATERARDFLSDGEVQKARAVLANLASEMVVSVTNIPLGTFPDAIKAVSPLIDAGKIDEAKAALVAALNTLVQVDTVIALPVVRAELLLAEAETLAEKEGRSDREDEALALLLSQAKYQLKLAEALGYGKKPDYREYYRLIDAIKDKTRLGGFGKGFFDKIKAKLKALKEDNSKASGSPDTGNGQGG